MKEYRYATCFYDCLLVLLPLQLPLNIVSQSLNESRAKLVINNSLLNKIQQIYRLEPSIKMKRLKPLRLLLRLESNLGALQESERESDCYFSRSTLRSQTPLPKELN